MSFTLLALLVASNVVLASPPLPTNQDTPPFQWETKLSCSLMFDSFSDAPDECKAAFFTFGSSKYPIVFNRVANCLQKRPNQSTMCYKPLDQQFKKIGNRALQLVNDHRELNETIMAPALDVAYNCGRCIL
jgi:hypothetical protein